MSELYHVVSRADRLGTVDPHLSRYLEGGGLPAGQTVDNEELDEADTLSILASRTGEELVDFPPLGEWPHADGRLDVNPLFVRQEDREPRVHYIRRYPSQYYADENRELSTYLPESFSLDEGQLTLPDAHKIADVDALISHCAVLGFPDGYLD
jgi:hypothetical protein